MERQPRKLVKKVRAKRGTVTKHKRKIEEQLNPKPIAVKPVPLDRAVHSTPIVFHYGLFTG